MLRFCMIPIPCRVYHVIPVKLLANPSGKRRSPFVSGTYESCSYDAGPYWRTGRDVVNIRVSVELWNLYVSIG